MPRWPAAVFALAIAAASAAGQPLPQPPQTAPQNGPPQKGTTAGGAPSRVQLQPKFAPGDVMRYQVQFQTTSQTTRSGAVSDPQGPSQTVVTWDAVLRVEVLPAPSAGAAGTLRLRTTYEKSVARLDSDTPDPEQESVEKQYAQMEGKSMEFTLDGAGRVSNVQGLEGIVSGEDAVKAAGQWMAQFSASTGAPVAGIALGEKWSSEESAASLPLAGYVWRTDSSYLRNEACHPASLASPPAPSTGTGESCAVILAQLTLRGPRSKKDPTPQEFRRNGLETSGAWSGSGDSLTYVSLENGWVVSVTQNMSEQMDVTISKGSENGMHYAGTVATRSSLSLVPPDPATSPQ